MDSILTAAALALAKGDVLGALNRVALRGDPAALAMRGTAMAQLGDFARARQLLQQASHGFGRRQPVARARCIVAEAEIALVSRDLGWPPARLEAARVILWQRGDRANAALARTIVARRHLLLGQLDLAASALAALAPEDLPPAIGAAYWLIHAGIATRQRRVAQARQALAAASAAAAQSRIAALLAEVAAAIRSLDGPVALLRQGGQETAISLDAVETLLGSGSMVVDATRSGLRKGEHFIALATRPVLFALLQTLAEAWPGDATRQTLLARAFNARHEDESQRARLRVEIARLRQRIAPIATVTATSTGFRLTPHIGPVAVLAFPLQQRHAAVLALLADGELWSSSGLALVLDSSTRTVQRALEELQRAGKVQPIGRGRAQRWSMLTLPGFPTTLLLPEPG